MTVLAVSELPWPMARSSAHPRRLEPVRSLSALRPPSGARGARRETAALVQCSVGAGCSGSPQALLGERAGTPGRSSDHPPVRRQTPSSRFTDEADQGGSPPRTLPRRQPRPSGRELDYSPTPGRRQQVFLLQTGGSGADQTREYPPRARRAPRASSHGPYCDSSPAERAPRRPRSSRPPGFRPAAAGGPRVLLGNLRLLGGLRPRRCLLGLGESS